MLDHHKQIRFDKLRQRQSSLSESEQAELASLVRDVEEEEAKYLSAATGQIQKERETLESKNRQLENLIARKDNLAFRLRSFLAEARAERQAISQDLATVLAGNRT